MPQTSKIEGIISEWALVARYRLPLTSQEVQTFLTPAGNLVDVTRSKTGRVMGISTKRVAVEVGEEIGAESND